MDKNQNSAKDIYIHVRNKTMITFVFISVKVTISKT